MRTTTWLRNSVAAALLALTFGQTLPAQNLYGEDLVWRLASPSEIREVTSIGARKLRKESRQAEPLFVLTPPPFSDVPAAPPSEANVTPRRAKQWKLPPWTNIDPALPADLPEEVRKEWEARQKASEPANVWSEIPVVGQDQNRPSIFLRPRPVAPGEEFIFRNKELPPAFSLRRYHDGDENVFVEIAAYGGTTSFKAEEAYRAMKEAATKQDPLLGLGEEAFLTRVVVTKEPKSAQSEEQPFIDGPALPTAPPFAEIAPSDIARPDLLDSGRAVALAAPAFTDVAVADLEGKRVIFHQGPKKYVPKGGEVKQSLMVAVAFFPDQAVTLTFAIEERLGNVQDLIAVAMLAQRKLREDIVARD